MNLFSDSMQSTFDIVFIYLNDLDLNTFRHLDKGKKYHIFEFHIVVHGNLASEFINGISLDDLTCRGKPSKIWRGTC